MDGLETGQRGSAAAGTARDCCLSTWGYLLFTAWTTLATVLACGRQLVPLLLLEMTFGLLWSRAGLRLLRRPRFWIFILGAVALGPFLIGEPDGMVGPWPVSRAGLVAGLEMGGRAASLTLAFSLGLAALSLSDVIGVFDRLGLRGLGFAAALALNLLGTLQEMASVTWQTIRLREGMRRPVTALRLFLITTVANTLRYGDDVVNAATVRAFDPTASCPAPLPLHRADLWLAVALSGYSGVLMLCSGFC